MIVLHPVSVFVIWYCVFATFELLARKYPKDVNFFGWVSLLLATPMLTIVLVRLLVLRLLGSGGAYEVDPIMRLFMGPIDFIGGRASDRI